MKNSFFNLLFITFIFYSCSKDENVANNVEVSVGGTVKRISETTYYNVNPRTFVLDFNYENGQLKSLSNGSNGSLEFVMLGNQIVQTKAVLNNVVSGTNNMLYQGNNLMSITQGDNGEKSAFDYVNGRLSSKTEYYSNNNGNPWILSSVENYIFNTSQNIESKVTTNQSGNSSFKSGYQYDDKNNVFKNMNPYLKYMLSFESFDLMSNNNVIKQFSFPTVTSTLASQSHYYTIIYNDANYPISIKKYGFVNNQLISECIISYN